MEVTQNLCMCCVLAEILENTQENNNMSKKLQKPI